MLTIKDTTKSKYLDFEMMERLLRFATDGRLSKDVTINIIVSDRTLDRLTVGDYEMQAILYRTPMRNVYSLFIRKSPATSLMSIAFHEATHLIQYESGRLSMDESMKKCSWDGVEYTADYPYMKRPWEVEAFKEQRRLEKEWRALQKSLKKVRKSLFGKKSK